MVTQTTKIRNGTITLPKSLSKPWQGADVFVRASEDTIVIKRISRAPFWDIWQEIKMKGLGKKISQKDIKDAIAWARRQAPK